MGHSLPTTYIVYLVSGWYCSQASRMRTNELDTVLSVSM